MHPAFSIIFFTTASGAGYGIVAAAGLLALFGLLPEDPWLGGAAIVVAAALIAAGLVSSVFHLGRPERAWRALSQWRSSWLSREGVAAILSFGPILLFAALWVFGGPKAWLAVAGLLAIAAAAVTVGCTAMIYASLKPIRRWHNRLVLPNYLALSLMTGALWLAALARLLGHEVTLLAALTPLFIAAGWLLKEAYWRFADLHPMAATIESATGLGRHGKVRAFEAPHTEENYLLKEMGFRIGRKHAEKLRLIARVLGFGAPLVLALLALLSSGAASAMTLLIAAISASVGILVERWLFFAEAKHTVALYYGYGERAAA